MSDETIGGFLMLGVIVVIGGGLAWMIFRNGGNVG